ncbi:MAG: hypothetical protein ALECFALPRED_007071 [Alectoria fallacina]|uniref:STB6-like N-terminal domain-containing protein n=1 Tax=Alectoria fallacina TaxID=1903189 RepID=A0A8H3IAE8_9LECA|nr:MAG: hypothetical protein ALECFALPRED_007071 [Alectoria fallacina]
MDNDTEERDFATEDFGAEAPDGSSTSPPNGDSPPQAAHQRLVFTDPAAFRYLEEDPSTMVLERRRRLTGYELYIVEQWACSRVHPTFVITTYTGLEQDSVVVGVLSVPTNEEAWSPRLRVYLKAITKYHARKKETPLGTLMVTNLSGFPSAMTVIAVPDGDLKKHREDFIVNENMKRMGCSGRVGLNLSPPVGATQAKFMQLYHTSDRIPLYNAVIELVKLCQVALLLFGKLAPEYADGLLCDVTEQAINDWWTELGTEYFNIDPSDGILGPTTVAALLGILMGARNRLNAAGAPVAKDVFDIVNTKRGIAHFQRSQKMERTRRFDRQTLDRLHKVTAKAASGKGWTVPRAVKSTAAELSGKGGELVHGREKAGIAEMETLDIETFVQMGSGERFKWLWYGKARKNNESDVFSSLGGDEGMILNDNEQGGGKKRDSVDDDPSIRHVLSDRIYLSPSLGSHTSIDHPEKDQGLRKAVFKNVTGKATDARSGLGRIRDAVGMRGLRGHHHKYSKDVDFASDGDSLKEKPRTSVEEPREPELKSQTSLIPIAQHESGEHSQIGSQDSSRRGSGFTEEKPRPEEIPSQDGFDKVIYSGEFDKSASSLESTLVNQGPTDKPDYVNAMKNAPGVRSRTEGREPFDNSRKGSLTFEDTAAIKKMQEFEGQYYPVPPLRTTRSLPKLSANTSNYWERRWPRQLSFTAMVDVLASGVDSDIADSDGIAARKNPNTALSFEKSLVEQGRLMGQRLEDCKAQVASWVEHKVNQIQDYEQQAGSDQARLDLIYHQKFDEYHALHDASDELLSEERSNLSEIVKDLETLGAKLEYELSALESKVEDVENGVADFERQVLQLEARAEELDDPGEAKASWLRWFLRMVNV